MRFPSRQVPYWQLLAAVAVTAAVSITAFSVAQTGDTSVAKVKACYAKKGAEKGVLRKAKRCRKGERKLTWNTRGPRGTAGAPGASGVDASAVSGQVAFFDLGACPAGWSVYAPGAGRYVVGVPANGSLGG